MLTVAFPQDHVPRLARQLNSQNVPYSDQKAWVGVATLSGLPATIAPIGHSESGLPIGAQIVGGYPEDRTTVAFARMIQREFGGFVPPPRVRHNSCPVSRARLQPGAFAIILFGIAQVADFWSREVFRRISFTSARWLIASGICAALWGCLDRMCTFNQ